jgi:hypothetical protein
VRKDEHCEKDWEDVATVGDDVLVNGLAIGECFMSLFHTCDLDAESVTLMVYHVYNWGLDEEDAISHEFDYSNADVKPGKREGDSRDRDLDDRWETYKLP